MCHCIADFSRVSKNRFFWKIAFFGNFRDFCQDFRKTAKNGDFGGFSVFSKCSNSLLKKKKIIKLISFLQVLTRFLVPAILLYESLYCRFFESFKKSLFLENSVFWKFSRFLSRFAENRQKRRFWWFFSFLKML